MARAAHGTGIVVAEVVAHGTAVVVAAGMTVVDFRRGGIAVVVVGTVLVTGVDLLSVDVGVEVAVMLGVAVAQSGGGKALAIIVDDHRAEANLVATIPVNVGNGVVVIALTIIGRRRVITVPRPAGGQLVGLRIHVEGNHLVAGVDATCQEDTGLASIKIGGTEEVLRRTVAIAIAPSSGEVGLVTLQSL